MEKRTTELTVSSVLSLSMKKYPLGATALEELNPWPWRMEIQVRWLLIAPRPIPHNPGYEVSVLCSYFPIRCLTALFL